MWNECSLDRKNKQICLVEGFKSYQCAGLGTYRISVKVRERLQSQLSVVQAVLVMVSKIFLIHQHGSHHLFICISICSSHGFKTFSTQGKIQLCSSSIFKATKSSNWVISVVLRGKSLQMINSTQWRDPISSLLLVFECPLAPQNTNQVASTGS